MTLCGGLCDPCDKSPSMIPEVRSPQRLNDYLEVMTRAVFQAGLSWKRIAAHWDAYRTAFEDFDPAKVAEYGNADIERVLATVGILRSPRKVQATIRNAKAILELDREYGGFSTYLRSLGGYAQLSKDLKRCFAFMGEMNAWYFLFRVGEPVPRFESWVKTIPGEHPRMREMVLLARSRGRSPEI